MRRQVDVTGMRRRLAQRLGRACAPSRTRGLPGPLPWMFWNCLRTCSTSVAVACSLGQCCRALAPASRRFPGTGPPRAAEAPASLGWHLQERSPGGRQGGPRAFRRSPATALRPGRHRNPHRPPEAAACAGPPAHLPPYSPGVANATGTGTRTPPIRRLGTSPSGSPATRPTGTDTVGRPATAGPRLLRPSDRPPYRAAAARGLRHVPCRDPATPAP